MKSSRKYSNNTGLPLEIVNAILKDRYTKDEEDGMWKTQDQYEMDHAHVDEEDEDEESDDDNEEDE
mgnify:CR=1 FL=1